MRQFIIVSSVFSCLAGGCDPEYVPPSKDFTVKLWVQPDSNLPPGVVQEGCATWSAVGVSCELVDLERDGEVRVYAVNVDKCMWTSEGYVLGSASYGGDVTVSIGCLKVTGLLYDSVLKEVVGHEMGHQLGIWEHVPYSCDGTEKIHPDGGHVCGPALMNAEYHLGVDEVTPIDELAFDLRSRGSSVIGDVPRDGEAPSKCVYLKRR